MKYRSFFLDNSFILLKNWSALEDWAAMQSSSQRYENITQFLHRIFITNYFRIIHKQPCRYLKIAIHSLVNRYFSIDIVVKEISSSKPERWRFLRKKKWLHFLAQ